MARGNQGNQAEGTEGIRDAAAQVQQGLRDVGNQVRDSATQTYDQVRQTANEYYEQGRQRYSEWEAGIEQYVQEKPIQSLMIAAGVGMLLGVLWKRH
jgi:ElaB/YqjD/DUF883 family membrane-anchored ribosome-binding protein